jgi:hypothetical protein
MDGGGDNNALHFGKNRTEEERGNESARVASMSKRGGEETGGKWGPDACVAKGEGREEGGGGPVGQRRRAVAPPHCHTKQK